MRVIGLGFAAVLLIAGCAKQQVAVERPPPAPQVLKLPVVPALPSDSGWGKYVTDPTKVKKSDVMANDWVQVESALALRRALSRNLTSDLFAKRGNELITELRRFRSKVFEYQTKHDLKTTVLNQLNSSLKFLESFDPKSHSEEQYNGECISLHTMTSVWMAVLRLEARTAHGQQM